MTKQVEPGFHWDALLFFMRLDDGSVRIRKYKGNTEDLPIFEAIIPPIEWASIVCSVSAEGETADRWEAAQDFHGRQ